jgi:hypothetical protein
MPFTQFVLGCPQNAFASLVGVASLPSCPNGGNFVVRLLDKDGNEVERVADTCSPYETTRTAFIDKAGTYLLDLQAAGQWSISVDRRQGGRDTSD